VNAWACVTGGTADTIGKIAKKKMSNIINRL